MENEEYYVINKNIKNRIGKIGQRDSNLDLAFTSEDIVKYDQKDDPWGSNHFPIGFEVGINKKPYKKRTNRISTKKQKKLGY